MANTQTAQTIRQMLRDWNAATEAQRQEALRMSAEAVNELLSALKAAEAAMSKSPSFMPWDLGPSKSLLDVRAAIEKADGWSDKT